MKKKVTIVGKDFVTAGVLVKINDADMLFIELSYNSLVPFVCSTPYEVVEIEYDKYVLNLIARNKLLELKVKKCLKEIENNYSPTYLDKYFKGNNMVKSGEIDSMTINTIVMAHSDYLDEILFKNGEWTEKVNDIKTSNLLNRIEKDKRLSEEFCRYYNEVYLKK